MTRIGVVCDYLEEGWPSMDLVADTLIDRLPSLATDLDVVRIRPRMRPVALAHSTSSGLRTATRALNRFAAYPATLAPARRTVDLFHIVDHSYAHLVNAVGDTPTVVTCHDLDAFRSVLEPARDRRGAAFRALTRWILNGLKRSTRIVCDSEVVRRELAGWDIVPATRISVVPLGVRHELFHSHAAEAPADALLGPRVADQIDLLHVGSTIPRKRIDVVLELLARLRATNLPVRLVRVGGPLTQEQQSLARRLDVADHIVTAPFISPTMLAALYRRASLLVLPSEREGFGLPLLEALACGLPAVASDIPVLREVGGDAAVYAPIGDVDAWTAVIATHFREQATDAEAWARRRARAAEWGARFTWDAYSRGMAEIYREVLTESRVRTS